MRIITKTKLNGKKYLIYLCGMLFFYFGLPYLAGILQFRDQEMNLITPLQGYLILSVITILYLCHYVAKNCATDEDNTSSLN